MANFEPDIANNFSPSHERAKEYRLYVSNIPQELNKDGLQQLFENYGNVTAILFPNKSNWAFVAYATYQEAEHVIKDLHDTSPLYLKIQLKKEKNKQNLPESMIRSNDTRYTNKTFVQTVGRGRPLTSSLKTLGIVPECQYTPEDNLLYTVPLNVSTYNPYDPPDPYSDTNTLWTRGVKTTTSDGKRHVSLGRGYTFYEVPPVPSGFNDSLKSVYAKRNGLYASGENKLVTKIGHCIRCQMITKMQCEKCQEFYCSRDCQVIDWPVHKTKCQEIPGLIEATVSARNIQVDMKNQRKDHDLTVTQSRLRRPKLPAQDVKDVVTNSRFNDNGIKHNARKNWDNYKQGDEKSAFTKDVPSKNMYDLKQDQSKTMVNDYTCKASIIQQPEQAVLTEEDIFNKFNQAEENIAFKKDTFLSETDYTEVEIVVKTDNDEFWVRKVEDDEKFMKMMFCMQDVKDDENLPELKIGKMYAVEYEGLWSRAVITSLKPLKAHFIDYGNTEIVKLEDVRHLTAFQEVQPYARQIRISESDGGKCKHLKNLDRIFVKKVLIDRGKVIVVQIQDSDTIQSSSSSSMNAAIRANITDENLRTKDQLSTSHELVTVIEPVNKACMDKTSVKIPTEGAFEKSLQKCKSVVELLTHREIGMMQVHIQFSSKSYGVTIVSKRLETEFEKIFCKMPEECINCIRDSNFRPCVGDLICGKRITDGDWVRGYVLSTDPPLQIAVIDEARTAVVQTILPCPPEFSNICAFSAMLQVTDYKGELELGKTYSFEVTNIKSNIEIEILTEDESSIGKGSIKQWTPLPEQKGIQYSKLKTGGQVCITAYKNQYTLYVRQLECNDVEHYVNLSQSIARHAKSAKNLTECPVIGQMVIARYLDMNYYRAIIVKLDGTKAGIAYVDFGNTEYSDWKEFKELPDDLKQMRSCAVKITLKDVPTDVPMTKEVNEFLESLVTMETPLVCTFDAEPSKDGVELTLDDGENINKKVKNMLVPSHVKEVNRDDDKTCYMVSELGTSELGKVGMVQTVLILSKIPGKSDQYVMCPFDQQLITHVMEVMPLKMNDHCKNTEMYIPRDNELCLVLYENGWYRAVCLCRNKTPSTALVFFVDYGNIESTAHENIRKMTKDFMTPNALGSICTVVNLLPLKEQHYSAQIETSLAKLLSTNNSVQIKIIQALGDGYYNVEVPEIKNILEENSLPSLY